MNTAFLTKNELDLIERAIIKAEGLTSAEIVVCIKTKSCVTPGSASPSTIGEAVEMEAKNKLRDLCVGKTRDKNGVVILISPEDRWVAVCGDKAVSDVIKNWPKVTVKILTGIKKSKSAQGIIEAIEILGRRLKKHFPVKSDDQNEIPDRVVVD